MNQEPILQSILDAVNRSSLDTRERLDGLTGEVANIKGEIIGIKGEITGMKGEMNSMKGEITGIKSEITGIKGEMSNMKGEILDAVQNIVGEVLEAINQSSSETQEQIHELRGEVVEIKATMVTKSYLDDKLAGLRSDMSMLVRKEDRKLGTLIDTLEEHGTLNRSSAKTIRSMEPFAALEL